MFLAQSLPKVQVGKCYGQMKPKVIFSMPVSQIIVEEMLKKQTAPKPQEDDVLNTPLGGTAWKRCHKVYLFKANETRDELLKLFLQSYLTVSVAHTNETQEQAR